MSIGTDVRSPEVAEEPRKVFGMTLPSRGSSIGRPGRAQALVVGGEPRANLLPPEIVLRRKQLKTRRALRFGVFLVAVAVAVGCVGTFGIAAAAQVQLAATQATAAQLQAQQLEFAEVKGVQSTIKSIEAGQLVGGSTEINLRDYLQSLQATLPEGVVIQTVSFDSATPMTAFPQPTGSLQGTRVAALTFAATSAGLPVIPDWLRSLTKLDGFVDATPGSSRRDPTTGVYTTEVLMHISAEAFSFRFDPSVPKDVAPLIKTTPTTAPVAPTDTTTDTTDEEGN